MKLSHYSFILVPIFVACSSSMDKRLFSEVAESSGIVFSNTLVYNEEVNPYTYKNFYNGGGVALGDINNDGLLDIYLTGNQVDNKLFLNKGGWKFEDITEQAGVSCHDIWSTGSTFVDINGDGWLDLYVCKSGPPEGNNRYNELFINQRDGTFKEESEKYGLNFTGLSTHAAFFDYDKDGDLDCYLLNNSLRPVGIGQDVIENKRYVPDENGNKFLRNDDGVFTDITTEAGVYSSDIGYGLGITLSDFNEDGWTDIFISNDFFERDYLYINNQNGGFTEEIEDYFQSLSMGSMGADASDLNNDGRPELMVTEMLPATIERRRTKAIYESWDKYKLNVSRGYYHQYPRNVLQQSVGEKGYTEVGRLSGVSATEWSWSALIFDIDNDGLKDIYVSNGMYKDFLDRDFLNYMAYDEQTRSVQIKQGQGIQKLIDIMPSSPTPNAAFKNLGNMSFEESNETWGLNTPSFSNGSAYGDLDNDGDLDLVINNVNMPAHLFKNNSDTTQYKGLRLKLNGADKNTWGIGAKALAFTKAGTVSVENFPSKGFQSSTDPVMHLGLGDVDRIDSLLVYWASGGVSKMYNLKPNDTYVLNESDKSELARTSSEEGSYTQLKDVDLGIHFRHEENDFTDFDRERLLPQMFHNQGPKMTWADVDNNGSMDLYIGGAKGQAGQLYKGRTNSFRRHNMRDIPKDAGSEDTNALFFDCDNDGDLDLYVTSGGRAFSSDPSALKDRLYLNDGRGGFTKTSGNLPDRYSSTSVVRAADYDGDGDMDLFVGERFDRSSYGTSSGGVLLQNDGSGQFTDVTDQAGKGLRDLGMVTDAEWADMNGDGLPDLITIGDWQAPRIFMNEGGRLSETPEVPDQSTGWWNDIEILDADNDGDLDFVAGNHGENSFFKQNMRMYISDFDDNGTPEQIICYERDGQYYPIADKDELTMQLPVLKKKAVYYRDFASMTIQDLFPDSVLNKSRILDAQEMRSTLFINNNGSFEKAVLPKEVQYAPVYAIESDDLNGDGFQDLVLGGNQFLVKPQFGRFDGSKGLILFGSASGFSSENITFLEVEGQIRDIKSLAIDGKKILFFAVNDSEVLTFQFPQ